MNKKMKKLLGSAALGVLLAVGWGQREAIARVLGRVYANSLHVENEPRSNTATRFTLGNGDAYIQGDGQIDGSFYKLGQSYDVVTDTETIAAAGTITANACGGLKRISCTGDITTGTTNTITAPSSSNKGCRMLIENVGTGTCYLDGNGLFPLTQGFASMALATGGSIEVYSDGSFWRSWAWSEF